MSERKTMAEIRFEISKFGARLFRNNTALAWAGDKVSGPPDVVVLHNPRPIHCGLCKGSSDLIGWTVQTITPEMVGKKVAIFTAVEVKEPKGYLSKEQKTFLDNVKKAGGLGIMARCVSDVTDALKVRGVNAKD